MQNCAQMKELKCTKDILKCANEKRCLLQKKYDMKIRSIVDRKPEKRVD